VTDRLRSRMSSAGVGCVARSRHSPREFPLPRVWLARARPASCPHHAAAQEFNALESAEGMFAVLI